MDHCALETIAAFAFIFLNVNEAGLLVPQCHSSSEK